MENQEKICRLCFTKCTRNFECIEEITKDILDKLLVKINLGINEEPVLCTNCSHIIQRCFAFKSECLSIENYIVPFIKDKGQSKLNLKDVYRIVKNEEIEIPDDQRICRFCMNLIENEQEVIISERIMLEKCLPELDVTLTKNLVICSVCDDHLRNYYSFIMNCSKVEEMINKYYESTVMNRQGLIQLKDVIQFTTRNGCEEGDAENKLKEEEVNHIEIKHEQLHLMEMEDHKFNGTLQYSPKPMFESGGDDYKVDIIKMEDFDEKEEFKIKQEEEIFVKNEGQKFLLCGEDEIKTEDRDLDRLQDNVTLSQSEVSIELPIKEERLLPVTSRVSSCQNRISSNQTKYKCDIQKHEQNSINPSKIIFKCEFCSYQTYFKHNVQRHVRIHESSPEITIFKCEFCSLKTKRKCDLQRHMRTHRTSSEITMFKCNFCSYQTKYNKYLQKHILIHKDPLGTTMLKCNFCSYQTKHNQYLQKHILIHKDPSEVTMFKCDVCSYQAKQKCHVQTHMLIHKDVSEIKMFKCNFCSYQAKRNKNLQEHILTHKDPSEMTMFKCNFCPYQAKHKNYLHKHLLVHKDPSEITMFKCNLCSYQAKRKDLLQRHMLIHKSSSK